MSFVPSHWYPRPEHRACVLAAAAAFGLEPERLLGRKRTRETVRVRHAACWLLRRRLGLSLPKAARTLGWSDHTSALHAVRSAESLRQQLPAYRAVTDRLLRIDLPLPALAPDAETRVRRAWVQGTVLPEALPAAAAEPMPEAVDFRPAGAAVTKFLTLPSLSGGWCEQCDRRVSRAEVVRCRDRFCKVTSLPQAALEPVP